jgi:hypothetical protein
MRGLLCLRNRVGLRGWMGILIACMGIGILSSHAASLMLVEWEEGRLSVVAEGVPLSQVLGEIRERTGVGFAVSAEIADKIVSAQCRALPLVEGITKVLGSLDHSLVFDAQGRLVKVVIRDARAVSDGHSAKKGLEDGRADSDDPAAASTGLETGSSPADPMPPRVRPRAKSPSAAPSQVDIQIRGSFEVGGTVRSSDGRGPFPR